jgi:ribonucleotide reductase alpha subunit
LDITKIQKFTASAVEGLKNVSQSELEVDANLQFQDMMTSENIQQTLIKTAVDKIDIDRPDWTFVASRLFLYDIYHKVTGFTGYPHLREYFEKGESEGRILLGLKEKYNLDELNAYLDEDRDLQFTYLGVRTLYDRYLLKDGQGKPIELPQHLFMGVAMFLAQNEFDCQSWAKKFYDILSKFEVMAATPTLSNARTPRHQLSSCFPKGEKVLTYSGFKNIEDIKVDEFVLTHKNRFKKVYELLQRDYSQELYTFNLSGFEKETLKCTSEHPILAVQATEIECIRKGKYCILNQGKYKKCFKLEGEYREDCKLLNKDFKSIPKWIEAENIEVGDFLQVSYPTYIHNESKISVVDHIDLKGIEVVEDRVVIKRESCGYEYYGRSYYNNQIKSIKNSIPLNSDFMRLIGYYLAEGHIHQNLSSIHFTFGSKEIEYIEDTKNLLETLFDVNVFVVENRDNSTNVSVHNKLLGTFIYNLVGSGFNKKYLTDTILYAENQKDILVGTFRGDGCTIDNGMALSLSNKELIKQLYNIALREGLTPKIRVPKASHLATTQPYILEINYLNDKEFIEYVGKNLHKIEVKEFRTDGSLVGRAINQFWFNGNFFAKVNKIETKDINETVYNLEVEDDHSYVVNNIAVHNCYIGSSPDNIEGIFDAYKEMALLSKFGGGIGWDWSQVRGMGSYIDGHKHAAGGIVPFLKIANDVAIAVDQLGCVAKNSFVRVLDKTKEEKSKTIPISEVRIGDLIESFNIVLDKVQYKKVERVHELEVKKENQIKILFKEGYIVTSKWHPMAIKGANGYFYKRSDEIEVGEYGVNHNGKEDKILAIDTNPNISEEYMDLTVQGTNNYFASTDKSDNFYLTHNTRKGAIAVYVEPWHIDIRDFLDLKKNSGEERRRAHDLFPALWLNDLFMQRVQDDARWTLFDPYEVRELTNLYGKEFEERYLELESGHSDITRETISAKGLWKEILRSYFETGNPFLTFKDTANKSNPNKHNGIIRSSNLCVTGDTRLYTQFGMVKAKDLEENYSEIVASYDHRTDGDISKYGVGEAKALKMFKTKENADIYEVVTKDGYRIKSTMWHEYYISDGKSIKKRSLEDISVGDKLLIQSDEGQFGKDGSYDLGFLMGMVAGDGTFSYKESKQHSIVHIDLYNEDMNLGHTIHKQVANIINEYYSLLPNSHKEDFVNLYPKPIQHTKNSQKLRFSNIRLGRIFDEQFNFNGQTKHQIPEVIFKGTKETVKGYIKGLFIADGTVNIIRNSGVPSFAIQLASIKKSLLEEVQMLLANFGIHSKISKMRDAQEEAFAYTSVSGEKRVYASHALYRLNINGLNAIKYIDEIGFIGAKQTKALEVLSQREKLGYPRAGRKSEKFIVEISEINYIGKEDVYDTTQIYNHSLIFNGLVTGNCTEIFQNTSPNHYKIKLTYVDQTTEVFEEEEMIKVDSGMTKPAKKITALDSLNGKHIWMVDKEQYDGETAVCNLASINLSKIHTKEDLKRVIPTAIRMLDNVIDLNFYPLSKVKKTNEKTRAIGLGVMGEAQMLAESKIEWGSTEHFYKIDEVMESVSYYAIKSSSDLALEKGKYPHYEGSDWSKGIFPIDNANKEACKLVERGGLFTYTHNWNKLREKVKIDGMRNGYLMAVAPTSSISILTGTTQAIEPVYKRKWFEENLSGLIPVVAPNLSAETWQYYTPSYELDQNVLVKAGAIRQKWIDQGQSLNIFITLDKASGRYLNEIYMNAWKYGLKSTYYLRSQSPETSNDVEDRSQECVGCQ